MRTLRESLVQEGIDSGMSLTEAETFATMELSNFMVARWPGSLLRLITHV